MGTEEEEEKIPKGDDVIVELHATLEDLYMGGSLKVLVLSLIVNFLVFILLPFSPFDMVVSHCQAKWS